MPYSKVYKVRNHQKWAFKNLENGRVRHYDTPADAYAVRAYLLKIDRHKRRGAYSSKRANE